MQLSDDAKRKWYISVMYGLLFILLSLPLVYGLVNGAVSAISGGQASILYANGAPNMYGIALHGLVFAILVKVIQDYASL